MSKRSTSIRAEMHQYQRDAVEVDPQEWTKKTKAHVDQLHAELGDAWLLRWRKQNDSYAVSLGFPSIKKEKK